MRRGCTRRARGRQTQLLRMRPPKGGSRTGAPRSCSCTPPTQCEAQVLNRFFLVFRTRWFRTFLVVAVLAILIWFFGPLLGLGPLHPLETDIARWVAIGALFVLWLI